MGVTLLVENVPLCKSAQCGSLGQVTQLAAVMGEAGLLSRVTSTAYGITPVPMAPEQLSWLYT